MGRKSELHTVTVHNLECSLAIKRWQEFGRQVYIVSQPPEILFLINRSSELVREIKTKKEGENSNKLQWKDEKETVESDGTC